MLKTPSGSLFRKAARRDLIEAAQTSDKTVRRELRNWIGERLGHVFLPVTVTFKQWRRGQGGLYRLTQSDLAEALRRLLRFVDKQVLGRAKLEHGERLTRFAVWEYAERSGLHAHLGIRPPSRSDANHVGSILRTQSRKFEEVRECHIGDAAHKKWLEYCLKPKATGALADHLDLLNTWLPQEHEDLSE